MIQTKYGEFDGNKWEAVCQVCFKIRYEEHSYQEIKADGDGDHGIEGFTKRGDAFQCYCPEKDYTQDELHEHIRDKVTEDLKKLVKYRSKLKSKLNGTKIKRWILVTPNYHKNKIIDHCSKKSLEYRQKNIEILDDDFEVLIYDAEYFAAELPVALGSVGDKLFIQHGESSDEDIAKFKSSDSSQAINVIKKTEQMFEDYSHSHSQRQIDTLAAAFIRQYLQGAPVISELSKRHGKLYERYLRAVDDMAEQLDQKRIFHESSRREFIKKISSEVNEMVNEDLSSLDRVTRNKISQYVVALWLADCPLRFD